MQKNCNPPSLAARAFRNLLIPGTINPSLGVRAMDVNFIRKLRIATLIQGEGKGGQARFAEKVGTNASHISNMLKSQERNVGDDLAHRTEDAYDLPRGSLDFPDEQTQQMMMKFVLLPDDGRQKVFDFNSFMYEQTDKTLADTPGKLASYFRAIAKMIDDREKKKKK